MSASRTDEGDWQVPFKNRRRSQQVAFLIDQPDRRVIDVHEILRSSDLWKEGKEGFIPMRSIEAPSGGADLSKDSLGRRLDRLAQILYGEQARKDIFALMIEDAKADYSTALKGDIWRAQCVRVEFYWNFWDAVWQHGGSKVVGVFAKVFKWGIGASALRMIWRFLG